MEAMLARPTTSARDNVRMLARLILELDLGQGRTARSIRPAELARAVESAWSLHEIDVEEIDRALRAGKRVVFGREPDDFLVDIAATGARVHPIGRGVMRRVGAANLGLSMAS